MPWNTPENYACGGVLNRTQLREYSRGYSSTPTNGALRGDRWGTPAQTTVRIGGSAP